MKRVHLALFLALIVAANVATSRFGLVPVGFGLTATAGTYFAAFTFVVRDAVHDTGGRRYVLAAVLIGAALSAVVSLSLALASGAAFLVSETVDWGIYSRLRAGGYLRAAAASNVAGATLDTVCFLTLAGFPLVAAFPGQMLAKLTAATLGTVVGWWFSTTRTRAALPC